MLYLDDRPEGLHKGKYEIPTNSSVAFPKVLYHSRYGFRFEFRNYVDAVSKQLMLF